MAHPLPCSAVKFIVSSVGGSMYLLNCVSYIAKLECKLNAIKHFASRVAPGLFQEGIRSSDEFVKILLTGHYNC